MRSRLLNLLFAICCVTAVFIQSSFAAENANLVRIARERALRNTPQLPKSLIPLCDSESSSEWCEGYFSGIITSLRYEGIAICVPTNDVGRWLFDGVWTMTKAWLYRQPVNIEITFYNSVRESLTEDGECSN
jgi:hypothetical protein